MNKTIWLTCQEATKAMGMSRPSFVNNYAQFIDKMTVGKRILYSKESIEQYLAHNKIIKHSGRPSNIKKKLAIIEKVIQYKKEGKSIIDAARDLQITKQYVYQLMSMLEEKKDK